MQKCAEDRASSQFKKKNMSSRDRIFDKIGKDLIVMSKITFKQMQFVSDKLHAIDNPEIKEELVQNELILDGLEVKIRKKVIGAIVLYSPRASDLRKIMACYDTAISLERTGDLLLNINKHLNKVDFKGELYLQLRDSLFELIEVADTMLKNAIYSFTSEDLELTRQTIKNDDIVDDLYKEISAELISLSSGKTLESKQIEEIVSLSALSYNIERIADNATNIVEAAVYLIEGKNIQHLKLDDE